ncbi:hypothetical protein AtEden1_Chr1g0042981 [Arabidopsis thaliana]
MDFNEETTTQITFIRVKDLDDESEVMVIPERHDGEGSNSLNRWDQEINSQNSNISTYSPLHDFPVVSWNFYTAGNLPHRFSSSSNSSTPIASASFLAASGWRPTTRPTYEFGESSKRKKGKQVWEDPERNIRQRRMELGIRFYLVDGEAP